jgi:ankyrin repeat protein
MSTTPITLAQKAYRGTITIEEIKAADQKLLTDKDDESGGDIFYYSCRRCKVEIVEALLNRGIIDMNKQSIDDWTGLMGALDCRQWDNAKLLISSGANVTLHSISQRTALHCAAYKGAPIEIINMLLDAGADPLAETNDGKTPAEWARAYSQDEIAQYLDQINNTPVKSANFLA